MWMRKMSARSLSVGKSTKKISSKRPFRRSSGGSPSIRLTVAMTKQGLVFSCIQERKFPKTRWLVPPSVLPLPPHAGEGFFHLIDPKTAAPDPFGGLYGQPHVALRFADQAAKHAADIEADQRHRPDVAGCLGRKRLPAPGNSDQEYPALHGQLEFAGLASESLAAHRQPEFEVFQPADVAGGLGDFEEFQDAGFADGEGLFPEHQFGDRRTGLLVAGNALDDGLGKRILRLHRDQPHRGLNDPLPLVLRYRPDLGFVGFVELGEDMFDFLPLRQVEL